MRFSLFALSAVLMSCAFSAQAKMYKWVDENGQVHFGDKIPPKYLVKQHEELNEQGVTTKVREAAKTPEEKAEEKRLERERKKAEILEKRKKARDRVLLDTYTTERDLIVARDSRLDAVNSQIKLAETIISDSNKKIESMEKQVVQIKASNREVPIELYDRIDREKCSAHRGFGHFHDDGTRNKTANGAHHHPGSFASFCFGGSRDPARCQLLCKLIRLLF